MSDQTTESTQESQEQVAPAVPDASGASQVVTPSAGAAEADALLERRIQERIDAGIKSGLEQVDRKWQSTFDKKTGRLDRVLALAKKHGDNTEAIQHDLEVEDMLDERRQRLTGTSRADVSQPGNTGEEKKRMEQVTAEILSDAGIDFKDPKYIAFYEERKGKTYDAKSWELEVRRFKDKYVKQAAAGDGAETPERGQAAGKKTEVALTEDYKKEMYAARGKGMDVGRGIKEKYRALGLNVDGIRL